MKNKVVGNAYMGTCPYCGKSTYRNRKEAKAGIRDLLSNGRTDPEKNAAHMRAYECREGPDGLAARWHFGHLPAMVRYGERSADEHFDTNHASTHGRPSEITQQKKGHPDA